MIGRIIEIAQDNRHLYMYRGFMVVQDSNDKRKEIGRVPLGDIAAVIANAHGLTYTNNLLVSLVERGVLFVLCAANHNAIGMLLSQDGHHYQAKSFLVHALHEGVPMINGRTPIIGCLQKLAASLALVYLKENDALELPLRNSLLE